MVRLLKSLFLMVALLFPLVACEEDTNTDAPSEVARLSCTYWVNNTSHSYYQCDDFSNTDATDAEIEEYCDDKGIGSDPGVQSTSCPADFEYRSGTYPSTGSCVYEDSGDEITSRWHYDNPGDGLSETALCSNRSGQFTAD